MLISLTMSMGLIRMLSENFVKSGLGRITICLFGPAVVSVRMNNFLAGLRVKVLLIRIVLALLFAFLLSRFFLPDAGMVTKLALAVLLVLAAYVLESFHKGRRP
jgi:hypothetical protein